MKLFRNIYTYVIQKAKDSYVAIKATAHTVRITAQKMKSIVQPTLKKVLKEKISIPYLRIQVNKGFAIAFSYVGIHALEYGLKYYMYSLAMQSNPEAEQSRTNSIYQTVNTTVSHFLIGMGNILLTTTIFSMKRVLTYYLRNSVEVDLKNKMARDWLSNKASSGIIYLQEVEGQELLPVSEIFSNHIAMSAKGISLLLNMLSDVFSIIIDVAFIKKLFDNPKLLMHLMGWATAVAVVHNKLFYNATNNVYTNISQKSSEINSQIVNIQQFGMQTIALQGEKAAQEKLSTSFRERELLSEELVWLDIKCNGVSTSLSQTISPMLDMLFPETLTFHFLNRSGGYFYNNLISDFINRVVQLSNQVTQDLPPVKVSLDQVTQFNRLLRQWEAFNRLNLLQQRFDSRNSCLTLHSFKVHIFASKKDKKEKKETIEQAQKLLERPNLLWGNKTKTGVSFTFKKGKVYLFPDLSGAGKTTILKALLRMYPLTSGNLRFPCKPEEVHFVDRNTFIPTKSTLLEAIIFPSVVAKEEEKAIIEEVQIYIDKMGFIDSQRHKDALLEIADWSAKLSSGEKQRFAMIGILIKKPKVLVLDEALGNLDLPSKFRVEGILKQELKKIGTIFLYADHHPVPGFVDFVVSIKDGNLVCIMESHYDYPHQKLQVRINEMKKEQ